MEIASIDEAYIDVTEECSKFQEAVELGKEIKEAIFREHGISYSEFPTYVIIEAPSLNAFLASQ